MNPVEPAKRSKNIAYEVSGSSTASKESSSAERVSPSDDGSLEKVRDILFGAQSREFDQRVQALEQRLLQESANLREEVTCSLESLKAHFTQEVSKLTHDIQEEKAGRKNSLADVEKVIQSLQANIEGQFSNLTQQTIQQHAAIEQQITQEKTALNKNYDQRFAELQQQFQESLQLLKKEKTDRAVLAEMLMDLALRLKVGPRDEPTS